ncbi:MAG: DNA polymerase III subunit alpha [Lachnospiraceae bacterium]|nr:DNA polymerase III subunit alpha [Lachnospiraceae bacterium]
MAFTHLHVHTEYSILDGSNKVKEYVAHVKEMGMTAAAITDHGVMYGCMNFYKEALAQGIKPILGCEVYVSHGSRFEKKTGNDEARYYHLILLAENNKGYENLVKLVSAGFTEGFYYKPRVDKELLRKYHEGLICLSACLAGEIPRHILMGDYEGAKKAAFEYRDIFGENNFFLEIQDHGMREEKMAYQGVIRLHEETGIPIVATNDCHYTRAEDAEPHDILLCIQTQKKVTDEDRMRYEGGQYYVKSEEEMRKLFHYIPEACDNTQKIADRCNVEIRFHERKIPKFDIPEGFADSWEYLQHLCEEGLQRCYGDRVTPAIRDRLTYELDTIHSMGFVDYFLIVWDYVHFAKSHGIMVGPGRGSAAGSIVSYCLGITTLDPIANDLIFERFLNPERVTMPDIDVDFEPEGRQAVIDYVVKKYGRDRVVQIITFGTMAARGVIRDVGRALDYTYAECDRIAKMIPRELNITLDKALVENPDLKKEYDENEHVRYLIDMSRPLEGLPRNISMHAAGVIISNRPVVDYVPLSRAQDGSITTQYEAPMLEELGLLKMDFLGLRNLTVIVDAKALIEEKGVRLDLDHIDDNDPKVMDMIGKGKCEGVFQLESSGMKSFMKELKPRSLADIIAGIALYRPGPMDFIPRYIEGKEHPEKIHYECPQMEPILKDTYGCIVYQEQVMRIVRDLAGYSMGRSDLVRRAMSKKKTKVMEAERKNFVYGNEEEGIKGCVGNGISEQVANHIYDEMIDFAKYAFNKSHAAAYAVISLQTAYLKCYYPHEYMAALMTSVIDNSTKCAEYLLHCRDQKIPILPPSVNRGEGRFTTEGNGIRYGMYAIKALGRNVIDEIVGERRKNGLYQNFQDFVTRLYGKVSKKAIENLIKAGALDDMGATRKQLMMVYPEIVDQADYDHKESITGQMSLFDFMAPEEKKNYQVRYPEVGEYSPETRLAFEKEVLGVYLTGHPLEEYASFLKSRATALTTDFYQDEETGLPRVRGDARVTVGGMITSTTIKYTKTNQVMAFLTVEDLVGSVEILVFPKTYQKVRDMIGEDAKVFVEGRVSAEDDKASKLICERVLPFDSIMKELWIQFADKADYEARKEEITDLLEESQGNDMVCIFLKKEKQMKKMNRGPRLTATPEVVGAFKKTFGEKNVTVRVPKY